MDLIIGGYASGKLAYAKELYKDYQVIDETNYRAIQVEEAVIINHLHLMIKDLFKEGYQVEEVHSFVMDYVQRCKNSVVICDEIGNGIVPMEKAERIYREETGRILVKLAKDAQRVVRITCGLEQVLK